MATAPTLTVNRIANRPDATPFQNAAVVVGAMSAQSRADQQVLGNLVQGLQQVDIEIQKNEIQENERYAKEMDNEFTSFRRQLLFGSDDGSVPGYYSLNGATAVDAAPGVKKQIEDKRAELLGLARTESAKQMFELTSSQRINTEFREMNRFTVKEQHVAQITASETRMKEAVDDAVLGWNNPSVLINSLATISQEVQAIGELQGWNAETIQSQMDSKRTLLYSGVITSMLQKGDDIHAREFFKTVESQMDAPVAAAVAEKIDNATLLTSIQKEANIVSDMSGSWAERIAVVRDNTDYTDAQKTGIVKELKAREQEDIRAEKANMKQIEGDVNQTIAGGGSLVEWMIANPDSAITLARDSEVMKRVEAYQKLIANGRNHPVSSDGSVASKLQTMEPHELAQQDTEAYRGQLTKSEFEKASGWIKGAQDTMRRQGQSVELYNQGNRWVKEFGEQAGIKWDATDSEADNKRQWMLENEMSGWIAGQVPPPTSEAIKDYAKFLTTTAITTPETWWGLGGGEEFSVADVMNLTPNDEQYATASIPYEVLSPQMINDAEQMFKRAKKDDYTTQDIADLWGATLTENIARKNEILGLSGQPTKPAPVPRKKQLDADAQFENDFQEFIGRSTTSTPRAPTPVPEDQGGTVTAPLTEAAPTPRAAPVVPEDQGGNAIAPLTEPAPITQAIPRAQPRPDRPVETIDRANFLIGNEGARVTSYDDSQGVRTIGIGFNLDRSDAKEKIEAFGLDFDKVYSGEQKLDGTQIRSLFTDTMAEAETDAEAVFSNFGELSENRQTALIDMMFNMGKTKWLTFKNSIKEVENEDWTAFVKRWKKSSWAKQVGDRADKVLELIEQG
jgi:GH24 family phage-related lysozyme (muramidase)